jgi:hypothetical protein
MLAFRMIMNPQSPSYEPCVRCAADCNWLGQDEGQCWGRVDLEDYAEDGSVIHACRGHQNFWDWCHGADVWKYIPENAESIHPDTKP